MEAREKIAAARSATKLVDQKVELAEKVLARNFHGNGAAVYAEPSRVRLQIAEAIIHLREAAKIVDATPWPTEADYDEADRWPARRSA